MTVLLDEVFGAENRIAVLVWDRNRKNDARFFSVGHEYMLVYAKDSQHLRDLGTTLREPKEGLAEAMQLYDELRARHKDDWQAIRDGWRDHFRSLADSDPRKQLGRFS